MLDYSVPIISGRKVKEENQTLFKKEKKRKKKYYYKYIYICISNCKCVDRLLCCNSVNTLRFALMSMGAVPGICLNRSMDPPPPPPISLPDPFFVLRCDPGRLSAPALSRTLFDSWSWTTSVPRPLRSHTDRQLFPRVRIVDPAISLPWIRFSSLEATAPRTRGH